MKTAGLGAVVNHIGPQIMGDGPAMNLWMQGQLLIAFVVVIAIQ